jgi:hypothetical protein
MPEPASHADAVRLACLTPLGDRTTVNATGGRWTAAGPGLTVRALHSADGTELMEQWSVVPDPDRPDREALDQLHNEIRAALRLVRRYGSSYPAGLPHLVGYDLDADRPYLLRRPAFGQPVADLAGRLLLNQRHGFQTSLFRALTFLTEAGVVHGGLHPGVVRWDGREVCLTGFGRAGAAGEPYRQEVSSPWMPPRATRHVIADPRDDVWAAGLIASHVVTGLPAGKLLANGATAESSSLASLLDGVFADEPGSRPGAAQILRRLGDPLPVDTDPGHDAALDAGRAAFDAERGRKNENTIPRQTGSAPPPPPAAAAGRFLGWLTLVAVVAVAGLVLAGWKVLFS